MREEPAVSDRPVQPKTPVSADVMLFGGGVVSGEFFTSLDTPRRAGPETLLDLLNDETRSFVPFQTAEGVHLLNRAAIRLVEFDSAELREVFERPDNEFVYGLNIELRTETQQVALQGCCYTGDLHPDARRPADLLNAPEMFLLVYREGKLTLVNKNSISHATV